MSGFFGRSPLSKSVTTTYDLSTASENLDLTGFGFTPLWVHVNFAINAGGFGSGSGFMSQDASQACIATDMTGGTTTFVQGTALVFMSNSAGTSYQLGVGSFISGGIRLAFTKVGTPTGTLRINAMGLR